MSHTTPASESEPDRVSFDQVFEQELDSIAIERDRLNIKKRDESRPDDKNLKKKADDARLVGLAFSGGGIRSATFNLGVLQGLAKLGLLKHFDYFSSVSGGGYIASWLHSWVHRSEDTSIKEVENVLAESRAKEPVELSWLRKYSNYLTPDFSSGSLEAFATVARNVLLQLFMITLLFSCLLMVPFVTLAYSEELFNYREKLVGYISNLIPSDSNQTATTISISFSLVLVIAVINFFLKRLVTLALSEGKVDNENITKPDSISFSGVVNITCRTLNATLLFFIYTLAIGYWFRQYEGGFEAKLNATVFLVPGFLVLLSLWEILKIGFIGSSSNEPEREKSSKIVATLLVSAATWLVIFGLVLNSAFLIQWAGNKIALAGGAAWIGTTVWGMISASGSKIKPDQTQYLVKAVPWVFLLGLVILVSQLNYSIIPAAKDAIEPEAGAEQVQSSDNASDKIITTATNIVIPAYTEYSSALIRKTEAHRQFILIYLGIGLFVTLILSRRIDLNIFSIHLMYRKRLERCYLGAIHRSHLRSNAKVVGFDPDDSPLLSELVHSIDENHNVVQRPFPIINSTINITNLESPELQERKAASFMFTPQYCGYQSSHRKAYSTGCYQKTERCNSDIRGKLGLGAALAISGAAATPNMGYHTTGPVAALMTIFNVRLGMWLRNSADLDNWESQSSKWSLWYLLKEMLSRVGTKDNFVYLSDGGHFENLAIYELVKRRCRYIVACDAEQDKDYKFEGLGNAIRKCRIDFGTKIEIDVHCLKPLEDSGLSNARYAVGKIIYQPAEEGGIEEQGYLIYIKPCMVGDEPEDIKQFKCDNEAFPQEATSDQWFSESQFESYRMLGYHSIYKIFVKAVRDEITEKKRAHSIATRKTTSQTLDYEVKLNIEHVFEKVTQRGYSSVRDAATASAHERTINDLLVELRKDKNLAFLSYQLFPETYRLRPNVNQSETKIPNHPKTEEEIKAGFYFCIQLMGLMENVYHDMKLEQTYRHPDMRGWINLFQRFSDSTLFCTVWALFIANFGSRFQLFSERQFGFRCGQVGLGNRTVTEDGSIQLPDTYTDRERKDIKSILEYERSKAFGNVYSVIPIEIRVKAQAQDSDDIIYFPVGYALIEGTYPNSSDNNPPPRKLKFFRIRDQLRGFGLGRAGLAALWSEDSLLDMEIDPKVTSFVAETNGDRFNGIWNSVMASLPVNIMKEGTKLKRKATKYDKVSRHSQLEHYEAACKQFKRVLELEPENEHARLSIASCKHGMGNTASAIEDLDKIIEVNRKACKAYFNRAAYRSSSIASGDDINKILKDIEKAIEIEPTFYKAFFDDKDFPEQIKNLYLLYSWTKKQSETKVIALSGSTT